MGSIDHAKREFLAAGYKPIEIEEDGPNKWIQENVLELLEVFSRQGHSGFSANFCIDYFTKLAKQEPLTPLSGEDSEWNDVDDSCCQNNRCSCIFKHKKSGVCYTIDGYVFKDQNGCCFTNYHSRKLVEFPYVHKKPTYVDVVSIEVNKDTNEPEEGSGWWETTYPDWIKEESLKLETLMKNELT